MKNDYARLVNFLKFTVSKKIMTSIWYNNESFSIHLILQKGGKQHHIIEDNIDISILLNNVKMRLQNDK